MTVVSYIATAIFFTGVGFLAAAAWSHRTICQLHSQRDMMIGCLWKAGARFRALGLDQAADEAFAATGRRASSC